jgi:hypothetical protein
LYRASEEDLRKGHGGSHISHEGLALDKKKSNLSILLFIFLPTSTTEPPPRWFPRAGGRYSNEWSFRIVRGGNLVVSLGVQRFMGEESGAYHERQL